jgi:excinuclease ABC subunit A
MEEYIVYSGLKDPQLEGLFGSALKIKRDSIVQITGPSNGVKTKLFTDLLYLESKKRLLNCLSSQQKLFLQNDSENIVEKIFPVIPVWNIERKNPIRDSRTNLIDLIGASNSLQNYFFHDGLFLCPKCKIAYISKNQIQEFILENSKSEEDIVYIEPVQIDDDPARVSLEEKVSRRLKVKNFQKIDTAVVEAFSLSTQVRIELNGKVEILSKNFSTSLFCKGCGDQFDKSDFHKGFLSNLNSYGACKSCNGYGAKLEYTADALISNYCASIQDSIRIFSRATYSKYLKKFEQDLNRHGILLTDKVNKNLELVKKILMDGGRNFEGFKTIFKELDDYKYKPAVRIFIRSVQSEVTCQECMGAKLNSDISTRINVNADVPISLDQFMNKTIHEAYLLVSDSKKTKYSDDFLKTLKLMIDFGLGEMKLNSRARDYTESQFQRSYIIKHYLLGLTDTMVLLDNLFYGIDKEINEEILNIVKLINERGNTIVILDESKFNENNFLQLSTEKTTLGNTATSWSDIREVKSLKTELNLEYINVIPFKNKKLLIDFKEKKINPHYFSVFKKLLFDEKITESIEFNESIGQIYCLDSQKNSVTSRSTIGTSTGILNFFRNYWAKLDESMDRAFSASDFSSNTANGMCLDCEGKGFRETDLLYFGTIQERCQSCNGLKHKIEALRIVDESTGFSFSDILQLRIDDLITFYPACVAGNAMLAEYLDSLGLEFLRIGDELNSLSRGELSRFKLALDLNEAKPQSLFMLENLSLELNSIEVQKIKDFIQLYLVKNHFALIYDPILAL